MSKKYGYVIDPRGKRIEIETTYDPLDDEKFKSKKHRAPAEQHFARLTRERQKLLKGHLQLPFDRQLEEPPSAGQTDECGARRNGGFARR